MAKSADSTNTFVLEYQGESESTKAAFNHLITALAEDSPEIEGFRLELTTANQFAGPFDMLVSQEATQEEIERPAEKSGTDEERDATSDEDSTSVPSLRSDALPSQVLSVMIDYDDTIRSSDLQDEFDDEEIDTARISQTLASLKRRELVAAKPDPEDKRANIYWPTEKGQQALKN